MHNERIGLEDTIMSAIMKMTEGNPGALCACVGIMKDAEAIDPQYILGGMGVIMQLDTLGIYGADIYGLFSDICDKSVTKMLAVLRAVQLGIFPRSMLKDACSRQDFSGKSMIPVDELLEKVKDRLDKFGRNDEQQ